MSLLQKYLLLDLPICHQI